ncbi:hypothetical protein FRC11_013245 [Ceratobasidium sp. 423]|nr:hypothetical protein FRC11_013245 [Ceratobasidium sp. 423]
MADPAKPPRLETTTLGPFTVPRVWTGLWQLSSPAWGTAPSGKIKREMARHVSEGYTAFDMGEFRRLLDDPSRVVGATKWCVFAPTTVTRKVVEDGVRERMERMKTERVDLLQVSFSKTPSRFPGPGANNGEIGLLAWMDRRAGSGLSRLWLSESELCDGGDISPMSLEPDASNAFDSQLQIYILLALGNFLPGNLALPFLLYFVILAGMHSLTLLFFHMAVVTGAWSCLAAHRTSWMPYTYLVDSYAHIILVYGTASLCFPLTTLSIAHSISPGLYFNSPHQFHWQNYDDKAYLDALDHLRDLQSERVITSIGLCNFDSIRTDEICTHLGKGVVVSNQVQFSLIDVRPLHGMASVCERHNLKLLTYGSLCGGFLADKWLGAPEPDAYRETMTPSQRKTFTFRLTQEDLTAIENVLKDSKGDELIHTIGDCGSEYR